MCCAQLAENMRKNMQSTKLRPSAETRYYLQKRQPMSFFFIPHVPNRGSQFFGCKTDGVLSKPPIS